MLKIAAPILAAAGLAACAQMPGQAPAKAAAAGPEVTLTRMRDCGNGSNDPRRFTDTFAYTETSKPFTFSCYVIKHGSDVMVWDTGYKPGSVPNAPKITLGEQLREMGVNPEQVKYVGISHFHADHTGQLDTVPNATLLINQKEWDAVTAPKPMAGANVAGFRHWIGGGGKVEPLAGDKDVFGDGTVVIFRTPGHTPGHDSLLVRLKEKGPVILAGDAVHFHENYDTNGVPGFNYDRADTLASMDRIRQMEKNLHATVIIQHDPRDIGKLPAFPEAAR
jgi:glyoxylase-like metal-dependent hydrolase (beta-lactamase superfamily II)